MSTRRFFNQAVTDAIDRAGGRVRVADQMGISYQSVHEWYSGERRIPGRRCHALARMAGVDAESLRPDLADYWREIREAA